MKKLMTAIVIVLLLAGCSERLPETPTVKVFENEYMRVTVPYDTTIKEYEESIYLSLEDTGINIMRSEYSRRLDYSKSTFNGYDCFISKDAPLGDRYANRIYIKIKGIDILMITGYGNDNLAGMFEMNFEVK